MSMERSGIRMSALQNLEKFCLPNRIDRATIGKDKGVQRRHSLDVSFFCPKMGGKEIAIRERGKLLQNGGIL